MQATDLTENPWAEIELPGGGMVSRPQDNLPPGIYDAGGQRRFTPGLGQDAGAAGAAARPAQMYTFTKTVPGRDGSKVTIRGELPEGHELLAPHFPAAATALEAPAGIPPSPFEAAPRLTLSGASMSAGPAGAPAPGPVVAERGARMPRPQAPQQPTMEAFQRERLARMGTGSLLNTRPAMGSPTDRIMRAGFAREDAQAEQRAERTRREASQALYAASYNAGWKREPPPTGAGPEHLKAHALGAARLVASANADVRAQAETRHAESQKYRNETAQLKNKLTQQELDQRNTYADFMDQYPNGQPIADEVGNITAYRHATGKGRFHISSEPLPAGNVSKIETLPDGTEIRHYDNGKSIVLRPAKTPQDTVSTTTMKFGESGVESTRRTTHLPAGGQAQAGVPAANGLPAKSNPVPPSAGVNESAMTSKTFKTVTEGSAPSLPVISTQADFDALPPGTSFLTPKGVQRIKPKA